MKLSGEDMTIKKWPDLVQRARIEKQRQAKEVINKSMSSISNFFEKLSAGVAEAHAAEAAETASADAEDAKIIAETEEEFIVHVKTCSSCKRRVAAMARSGVKLSPRVLLAAGVEVLN